jgi:hypothetical protein
MKNNKKKSFLERRSTMDREENTAAGRRGVISRTRNFKRASAGVMR